MNAKTHIRIGHSRASSDTWLLGLLFTMASLTSRAQELVVIPEWGNTQITVENGLIVMATWPAPFAFLDVQHDLLVSSEYLSFLYPMEDTTSIHDPLQPGRIGIFPNPSSDRLTLTRETAEIDLEVALFSVDGLFILQIAWPAQSRQLELALDHLPAAAYALRIMDETTKKTNTYRIVKR